jgi:GT2 family glycosyltransferase
MLISLIILNYNGTQDTLNCLKSLEKLVIPRGVKLDIIVIDQNSSDNSVKTIKKHFPQVFLLESSQNLGFAAGNNLGIKLALQQNSPFILLLNNDTLVDKNLLKELLNSAQRHPQGAIFAPKIYFAPGREFHKKRYQKKDRGHVIWSAGGYIDWQNAYGLNRGVDDIDHGQYDRETKLDLASGCCILIRTQALKQVGLFDARYFLYYEDTDLCVRIRNTPLSPSSSLPAEASAKAEARQQPHEESPSKLPINIKKPTWQIWYVPQAQLWHVNAGSSGVGSQLHDYFITRNRLLFGLTHAPIRAKYNLITESFRLLFKGRPWQRRGIIDFYLRKFGPGSWPK